MAAGDRITSARTCGLMRRINALENVLTGTEGTSNTPIGSYNMGAITGVTDFMRDNLDGNLYINMQDGDPNVIYKLPVSLTGGSGLITQGTDRSNNEVWNCQFFDVRNNVMVISSFVAASQSDSGDKEFYLDLFSTTGTFISQVHGDSDASFPHTIPQAVGILSDGTTVCAAVRHNSSSSVSYGFLLGSSFTETSNIPINPTKALIVGNDDSFFMAAEGSGFIDDGAVFSRRFNSNGTTSLSSTSAPSGGFSSMLGANKIISRVGVGDWAIFSTNDLSQVDTTNFSFNDTYHSVIVGADGDWYAILNNTIGVGSSNPDIRRHTMTATQTTWYHHPTPDTDTGKTTLGTVDYGYSVPVDAALVGLRPHYFELRDMRDALETVAVLYENPATAAAYTLTAGTNNIFRLAIDSGQDDWTTATITHSDRIRETDYSDIEAVLTQLELSALV
jgi:hypothetical protein